MADGPLDPTAGRPALQPAADRCAAVRAAGPPLGLITFVDEAQVRRKRDPGRCYRRAGFRAAGRTKAGLIALQLPPGKFPEPMPPRPAHSNQPALFEWSTG